jgi:hypothetical protein
MPRSRRDGCSTGPGRRARLRRVPEELEAEAAEHSYEVVTARAEREAWQGARPRRRACQHSWARAGRTYRTDPGDEIHPLALSLS